jgi:5'-nucleotidase
MPGITYGPVVPIAVRRHPAALALLLAMSLLAGCGGSGGTSPTTSTTSSTPSSTSTVERAFEILVTNDDGVAAPGIDAVVGALRGMQGVHVTVVAPAANESGSGDATTGGALVATEVKTAGGYPATAVAGKPGDSVIYALDTLGLKPDLVVSGTNKGQNIGPFSHVSGTVGAAKWAVRRGIPALAASTGDAPSPDFTTSARLVVDWVDEHHADIVAKKAAVRVESLNVPTCAPGTGLRGLLKGVPLATDFTGRDPGLQDCASRKPEAAITDDVDAFANGFASITVIPAG